MRTSFLCIDIEIEYSLELDADSPASSRGFIFMNNKEEVVYNNTVNPSKNKVTTIAIYFKVRVQFIVVSRFPLNDPRECCCCFFLLEFHLFLELFLFYISKFTIFSNFTLLLFGKRV